MNKYISVYYKLYTVCDGKMELVEETPEKEPFQFITGFGITLDKFEENVINLKTGDEFDFLLSKDEAYGDYDEERVLDLDRSIFCINGHFDHENIYENAIVPLQNEDGNRFYGRVLSVDEEKVKMDLNYPHAGKTLNFKGRVIESREASMGEIQAMINRMSGEGCHCGHSGGGCGGGCCGHGEHEGGGCCH